MTWFVWILLVQNVAPQPKDAFQSAMEKPRTAARVQREAARKQSESSMPLDPRRPARLRRSIATPSPILAPLFCSDSRRKAHQVDAKLLRGVIVQESGFRPCAVSSKGARWLMQLMPATVKQFQVNDAFDPKQNVDAGAKYLKQLLDQYKGDVALALAAYNAGPATVDAAGKIPDIKETRDYVDDFLKRVR